MLSPQTKLPNPFQSLCRSLLLLIILVLLLPTAVAEHGRVISAVIVGDVTGSTPSVEHSPILLDPAEAERAGDYSGWTIVSGSLSWRPSEAKMVATAARAEIAKQVGGGLNGTTHPVAPIVVIEPVEQPPSPTAVAEAGLVYDGQQTSLVWAAHALDESLVVVFCDPAECDDIQTAAIAAFRSQIHYDANALSEIKRLTSEIHALRSGIPREISDTEYPQWRSSLLTLDGGLTQLEDDPRRRTTSFTNVGDLLLLPALQQAFSAREVVQFEAIKREASELRSALGQASAEVEKSVQRAATSAERTQQDWNLRFALGGLIIAVVTAAASLAADYPTKRQEWRRFLTERRDAKMAKHGEASDDRTLPEP